MSAGRFRVDQGWFHPPERTPGAARAVKHEHRRSIGEASHYVARIEDNVGGMRVVQAFAREDHESRLFAQDNARYRSTKLEAYRLLAASTSLSYLGMRLTQAVVMVAGAYFVL